MNEQIEKQNQTFEIYLKCYVNYEQNDWIKWFSITKFVYNNNAHFVIKKNSFDMTFDFQINLENHVRINYKKNISAIYNRIINLTKSKSLFENK